MRQEHEDWLAQSHQHAADQYRQQERHALSLVERIHREACEQRRQLEQEARRRMDEVHRQAAEQYRNQPTSSGQPPSVSSIELPDLPADSPTHAEWQTYRRELPRLLKEGQAGKFALVKGSEVVGIFATLAEGIAAGREKYLLQPFLVQPIREREPLLRVRGHTLPCRSSIIRLPRMR